MGRIVNYGLAHITVWVALIAIGHHWVTSNSVYAAFLAALYLLVKTNDWYWAAKIERALTEAGIDIKTKL